MTKCLKCVLSGEAKNLELELDGHRSLVRLGGGDGDQGCALAWNTNAEFWKHFGEYCGMNLRLTSVQQGTTVG